MLFEQPLRHSHAARIIHQLIRDFLPEDPKDLGQPEKSNQHRDELDSPHELRCVPIPENTPNGVGSDHGHQKTCKGSDPALEGVLCPQRTGESNTH